MFEFPCLIQEAKHFQGSESPTISSLFLSSPGDLILLTERRGTALTANTEGNRDFPTQLISSESSESFGNDQQASNPASLPLGKDYRVLEILQNGKSLVFLSPSLCNSSPVVI